MATLSDRNNQTIFDRELILQELPMYWLQVRNTTKIEFLIHGTNSSLLWSDAHGGRILDPTDVGLGLTTAFSSLWKASGSWNSCKRSTVKFSFLRLSSKFSEATYRDAYILGKYKIADSSGRLCST